MLIATSGRGDDDAVWRSVSEGRGCGGPEPRDGGVRGRRCGAADRDDDPHGRRAAGPEHGTAARAIQHAARRTDRQVITRRGCVDPRPRPPSCDLRKGCRLYRTHPAGGAIRRPFRRRRGLRVPPQSLLAPSAAAEREEENRARGWPTELRRRGRGRGRSEEGLPAARCRAFGEDADSRPGDAAPPWEADGSGLPAVRSGFRRRRLRCHHPRSHGGLRRDGPGRGRRCRGGLRLGGHPGDHRFRLVRRSPAGGAAVVREVRRRGGQRSLRRGSLQPKPLAAGRPEGAVPNGGAVPGRGRRRSAPRGRGGRSGVRGGLRGRTAGSGRGPGGSRGS